MHKAGIITSSEANDMDGCLEDLFGQGDSSAKALRAVDAGNLDKGKLNDDQFLAALDAMDPTLTSATTSRLTTRRSSRNTAPRFLLNA